MSTTPHSTRSTPTDYLRRIEEKIDALTKSNSKDEFLRAALLKFQTSGAPMTGKEVAAILGVKKETVSTLNFRGQLKTRFGVGLYCSDDVREYLKKRAA
jgi:hypothetical protein